MDADDDALMDGSWMLVHENAKKAQNNLEFHLQPYTVQSFGFEDLRQILTIFIRF